jgi:hypothetical protein
MFVEILKDFKWVSSKQVLIGGPLLEVGKNVRFINLSGVNRNGIK